MPKSFPLSINWKTIGWKTLHFFGSLAAMAVWLIAGSIFHRSLLLFTRLDHTWINVIAAILGFAIMTACLIIVAYSSRIISERRVKKRVAL
jgi:hypothetical protein